MRNGDTPRSALLIEREDCPLGGWVLDFQEDAAGVVEAFVRDGSVLIDACETSRVSIDHMRDRREALDTVLHV